MEETTGVQKPGHPCYGKILFTQMSPRPLSLSVTPSNDALHIEAVPFRNMLPAHCARLQSPLFATAPKVEVKHGQVDARILKWQQTHLQILS